MKADPDTERHRLHTAVNDLLTSVGRERPVLLVLEDGHWADAPTLLLLRHLARAAGSARVLLLCTFRDTQADVPAMLSETLADLRRSDDVVGCACPASRATRSKSWCGAPREATSVQARPSWPR